MHGRKSSCSTSLCGRLPNEPRVGSVETIRVYGLYWNATHARSEGPRHHLRLSRSLRTHLAHSDIPPMPAPRAYSDDQRKTTYDIDATGVANIRQNNGYREGKKCDACAAATATCDANRLQIQRSHNSSSTGHHGAGCDVRGAHHNGNVALYARSLAPLNIPCGLHCTCTLLSSCPEPPHPPSHGRQRHQQLSLVVVRPDAIPRKSGWWISQHRAWNPGVLNASTSAPALGTPSRCSRHLSDSIDDLSELTCCQYLEDADEHLLRVTIYPVKLD